MKIKNLIAVAALLLGSTSAFATDVKVGGIGYTVLTAPTASAPGTVYVSGILSNTNGNAIKTAKAVTIPASITPTVDDETKTYNVVGIGDSWETNATTGYQDLSAVITSLTIDITNFNAPGLEATDFDGLTKLATLKIVDNGTVAKTKTTALPAIPATVTSLDIEGMKIKALSDNVFISSALKSVKLPATLETINAGAFQLCADLEGTIEIPATVKTIGTAAFEDSPKANIDLSKAAALESIANRAFQRSGITTANLNACVKLVSIGQYAFSQCKDLAKLQMSGLKDGEVFTTIGDAAFQYTAITAANIPASVTTIGEAAFYACKELTQVSAMAGLTSISNYLFQNCEKLEKFSVGTKVATIGTSAFDGCKALATITFKARTDEDPALTTIGDNAFKNCEALTSLDLSADWFTFDNIKQWFNGCKALKEILVSKNIKGIWASTFKDAAIETLDLSKTQMPQLQTIFGDRTADNVNPLKSIILPETCQRFDGAVFRYCTSLEEIDIPTAFEKYASDGAVPAYAFYYCTSLKNVNYEPTVKAAKKVFDDKAFLGCTPFVKINTNSYYYTTYTVPTNATFGTTKLTIKTVADKGTSGKFFAKFCPVSACTINPNDAKVYSVYVDQGVAYLQALIKRNGMYQINAGDHVIIKTDAEKEITATPVSGALTASVTVDDVFSLADDTPTANVHNNTAGAKYGPAHTPAPVIFKAGSDYLYRLTNNAATGGFGFTFFSGATMKADQFFIISQKNPNAGGRLQTVWLDENGFVEEEATAIQQIENVTEEGESYNLAGQKVNASYKGVVIKNGKKYMK